MEIDVEKFLKQELKGAVVDDFGIDSQFLKVRFGSDKYTNIYMWVDAIVTSNDEELNEYATAIKENISVDHYSLIFFMKENCKSVNDCNVVDGRILEIQFSDTRSIFMETATKGHASIQLIFELSNSDTKSSIVVEIGENDEPTIWKSLEP